jgi:DNA-directed RNA polymerase specialized sigma24 family protein
MNPEDNKASDTQQPAGRSPGDGRFVATSWTAVVAAGQGDAPESQRALAQLCQDYWRPIYAYVRRVGHGEDEAKDLTQEFFLELVSKRFIAAADRTKGRFRTFLLTSLNFFLSTERKRAGALKRGGGRIILSIDEEHDDGGNVEPATDLTPDRIYEQRWAASVLQLARERLHEEYTAAGKEKLHEHLKDFLEGTPEARGYQGVAQKLQMTPNAVGVAVHRMRQRCGELLRAEVTRTLVNPSAADTDAEMRFLLEALGR